MGTSSRPIVISISLGLSFPSPSSGDGVDLLGNFGDSAAPLPFPPLVEDEIGEGEGVAHNDLPA